MMTSDSKMIRVWRFEDAPPDLRKLSTHGGDEDWLAVVPPSMTGKYIPWLESTGFGGFGACDVQCVTLPDGSEVVIGAHA